METNTTSVSVDHIDLTEDEAYEALRPPSSIHSSTSGRDHDWWQDHEKVSSESWADITQVLWQSILTCSSAVGGLGFRNIAFGCLALARKHAQESDGIEGQLAQLSDAEIDFWMHYMRLASASSIRTEDALLEELCNEDDGALELLSFKATSNALLPSYFVVAEHARRSVTLVVRGTTSVRDLLTDLCAHCEPFFGGHVHFGMLQSCRNILAAEMHNLRDALNSWKGYELHFVGHSLGGGTAALMAATLRNTPALLSSLGNPHVHATTMGCPPVMSYDLALSCRLYVRSIVCDHDMVVRTSVLSISDLGQEMESCKNEVLANNEVARAIHGSMDMARGAAVGLLKYYALRQAGGAAFSGLSRNPSGVASAVGSGLAWIGSTILSQARANSMNARDSGNGSRSSTSSSSDMHRDNSLRQGPVGWKGFGSMAAAAALQAVSTMAASAARANNSISNSDGYNSSSNNNSSDRNSSACSGGQRQDPPRGPLTSGPGASASMSAPSLTDQERAAPTDPPLHHVASEALTDSTWDDADVPLDGGKSALPPPWPLKDGVIDLTGEEEQHPEGEQETPSAPPLPPMATSYYPPIPTSAPTASSHQPVPADKLQVQDFTQPPVKGRTEASRKAPPSDNFDVSPLFSAAPTTTSYPQACSALASKPTVSAATTSFRPDAQSSEDAMLAEMARAAAAVGDFAQQPTSSSSSRSACQLGSCPASGSGTAFTSCTPARTESYLVPPAGCSSGTARQGQDSKAGVCEETAFEQQTQHPLFNPGELWYLRPVAPASSPPKPPNGAKGYELLRGFPAQRFRRILLKRSMLSDHMVDTYIQAFASCVEHGGGGGGGG